MERRRVEDIATGKILEDCGGSERKDVDAFRRLDRGRDIRTWVVIAPEPDTVPTTRSHDWAENVLKVRALKVEQKWGDVDSEGEM